MENTKYKLLLIEDDKLDQTAFIRMVEDTSLPYDCTTADSVAKAQSILAQKQFDIVIADYLLGDGTALDILNSVKNTPMIFVTGAGDEEVAVTAWRAGAYDYLVKDVKRNYLKTVSITVENAIRHKRTEEKLRLLSHAILSTDDSVYITDMENRIIFVNKAFCETYGYREQEIIGRDSNILWMGKPQINHTRSVFQTISKDAYEVGFYHKRKDGGIFPVSLSRSPVRDEKGNEIAIVGVARDISERIQAEDKLRTLNQELEKQNRLKSGLAVTVLKDLKSSLAALQDTICNAITDLSGETSPALQENLESVEKNIARMTKTISNLYDMAKIDYSKIPLQKTKVDIQEVISEAIFLLTEPAAEKEIKLSAVLPPDPSFFAYADGRLVMQILTNLFESTIRFSPTGAIIRITVKDLDDQVQIDTQNIGAETGGDDISGLFNRFIQKEDFTGSDSYEITAGLFISKQLVETQGGQIWAERLPGQGGVLSFTLPKYSKQIHTDTAKSHRTNQV